MEVPLGGGRPRPTAAIGEPLPGKVERLIEIGGGMYAVAGSGLYEVDEHRGAWSRVAASEHAVLADRNISALSFDSAGRLWVGYFDRGLDILEPGLDRATHVENDHVFCVNRIVEDRERGITAVATANGLVLFDRAGKQRQVLGRAEGLIADQVTDVLVRPGGMTVATPAGITFVDAAGMRSLYAFHGLVNNHAYALASAGGRLLVGTLGGLSVLDGDAVRASYTTANSGLRHNWITAIAPVGGEWFVGTYGAGVLRFDGSGNWRSFPDLPAGFEVNANAMLATERAVYAGSLAGGLYIYERTSGRWKNSTAGLPSENVTALATQGGYIYAGTDNGLVRFRETLMKLAAVLLLLPALAFGDAGILIPSNRQQPDPAVLSLEEMSIDIRIDNGDARVSIRQIFASHHIAVLEGNYLFALPGRAAVSDFAVWDDVTRIPGVILERRRAEEIYQNLKWQSIDPGLLQMGEQGGAAEAGRTAVFSARIVPIPAYGTKRLEIEYHETIPVVDLRSMFAVPLRPDAYQAQTAGLLTINFELRSAHPIAEFAPVSKAYPLQIAATTPNMVRGTFQGRNVVFSEDFAVRYSLEAARADQLQVLTHREPNEPGFFAASALMAPGQGSAGGAPRTVVALFDNSLSMQWEKLERNFRRARSAAAVAAAGRPFQPAAVQHRGEAIRSRAGGGGDGGCRKGARVCAREFAARRHGSGESARCGAGAVLGRRIVPGAAERRRPDARHDPQCDAGDVVRGEVEAGAPAHVRVRRRRRRQHAAAETAGAERRHY